MSYYVYLYYRLDTNEVFYVGKGHENRYLHIDNRNKHFTNIINKVPVAVTIIADNLSEDEAFLLEEETINYYVFELGYSIDIEGNRSTEPGCHLVNMTWGGEGTSFPRNKEWKAKIGESNIGKRRNEVEHYTHNNEYYILGELPSLPTNITLMEWYDELAIKIINNINRERNMDTLFKALYPFIIINIKNSENKVAMQDLISASSIAFMKAINNYTGNGHFRDYFSLKIYQQIGTEFYRGEILEDCTDNILDLADIPIEDDIIEVIPLYYSILEILEKIKCKKYLKDIYIEWIIQDKKCTTIAKERGFNRSYISRIINRISKEIASKL